MVKPERVAMHYITSYFIFDIIGIIPFNTICTDLFGYRDKVFLTALTCTRLARFARLKTMLKYFKHITTLLRFSDTTHEIICLVLMTFYLLHWWACIAYIIPKLYTRYYHKVYKDSWIFKENVLPVKGVTSGRQYTASFLIATCHFYMAGSGYLIEEKSEQIIFSLIMISGTLYFSYIVVVIFEIMSSACVSETKYEEIMTRLVEYMTTKRFSSTLRKRLITYYESRFQKHYFRETAILSTLSEHLRDEIFLHCSRTLIEKVEVFIGLPKYVTTDIMVHLKLDVFLPNDVVFTAGSKSNAMYFISNGTVATYASNGVEVHHRTDGDYFGEVGLIVKSSPRRLCSIVAVELTECLRLDKNDFLHLVDKHQMFANRIDRIAQERCKKLQVAIQQQIDEIETSTDKQGLIYHLRKGKIISTGRRRHLPK